MLKWFVVCACFFSSVSQAEFSTEIVPYKIYGRIVGFKVIVANPVATKMVTLGVKVDDIITAVNGRRLKTLQDAQAAYKADKVYRVEVYRGTEKLVLETGGRN